MKEIAANLAKIREIIPPNVEIVAATKTVPAHIINQLPSIGVCVAGENRVQEMLEKYEQAKHPSLTWHFIGQLQTNKVKYIIDKVDIIHSLDRISLANEIQLQAKKRGKVQKVLVEINFGEQSKGGVSLGGAEMFVREVAGYENVHVCGLMSVLPIGAPEKMYLQMSTLYDKLKMDGFDMRYLSMGMSADYQTAVRHGANMIRLGSCLFGARR